MNQTSHSYHESSIAAVRLLQGPVYADDAKTWDLVLMHESRLGAYFAVLGLRLVISEADGFAYMRPFEEEEMPEGYESIPSLMRRSRLGFEATLLAVLLREQLCKFDEHDLDSEACAVPEEELLAAFADFYGEQSDEKRLRAKFASARRAMEELRFVRVLETEAPQILIRPIVKARLTTEKLREIKSLLESHLQRERGGDREGDSADEVEGQNGTYG